MDAHGSATFSIAIKIGFDQLQVSRASIGFAQSPKHLARLQGAKENGVERNSPYLTINTSVAPYQHTKI